MKWKRLRTGCYGSGSYRVELDNDGEWIVYFREEAVDSAPKAREAKQLAFKHSQKESITKVQSMDTAVNVIENPYTDAARLWFNVD